MRSPRASSRIALLSRKRIVVTAAVVLVVALSGLFIVVMNDSPTTDVPNEVDPVFDRMSPPLPSQWRVQEATLVSPQEEGLRNIRPVTWDAGFVSSDGRYIELWIQIRKECHAVASVDTQVTDEMILAVLSVGSIPAKRGTSRVCDESEVVRVLAKLPQPAPGLPVLNGREHGFDPRQTG